MDSENKEVIKQKTVGVFIVPLGLERELQITKPEAQNKILGQTNFSRLVIVVLSRGCKYESIKLIQEELSPKIMELAPADCANRS